MLTVEVSAQEVIFASSEIDSLCEEFEENDLEGADVSFASSHLSGGCCYWCTELDGEDDCDESYPDDDEHYPEGEHPNPPPEGASTQPCGMIEVLGEEHCIEGPGPMGEICESANDEQLWSVTVAGTMSIPDDLSKLQSTSQGLLLSCFSLVVSHIETGHADASHPAVPLTLIL